LFSPLAGYGIVDLKYKGEFFRGIKTSILNDDVYITSSDSKTKIIEEKYDKDDTLWGLNEEFTEDYVETYLEPETDKIIQKELS